MAIGKQFSVCGFQVYGVCGCVCVRAFGEEEGDKHLFLYPLKKLTNCVFLAFVESF